MATVSSLMLRVLSDFESATSQVFKQHPIAVLLRGDLRNEVATQLSDDNYKVKGSAGNGRWAETPWVAVFDRLVTESAQRGHYLVYLFRRDGAGVYLSLNQGTTAVQKQFKAQYLEVLRTRSNAFARELPSDLIAGLTTGDLDLSGTGDLTKGYEAGNIAAKFYETPTLPNDGEIFNDLNQFLKLYSLTVQTSDRWSTDQAANGDDGDVSPEIETREYRWHRRAERNRSLATKAKRVHGFVCQVCSFDFEKRYGKIGKGYIEAHHLTPFSELEGRPTELDPTTDFAVVCPNCHRMLHRENPPIELENLRRRLSN